MKKMFVLMIMGFVTAGFLSAQVAKNGTLYVAVKTVTLKSSTGFFASNKGTLNYGNVVTVLDVKGKFVQVRSKTNSSLTGWTATANLSAKKIVPGSTGSVTAEETAMAGKGFNQQVENEYKKDVSLNYADVEKVEAITVNYDDDLKKFLEDGHLNKGE